MVTVCQDQGLSSGPTSLCLLSPLLLSNSPQTPLSPSRYQLILEDTIKYLLGKAFPDAIP